MVKRKVRRIAGDAMADRELKFDGTEAYAAERVFDGDRTLEDHAVLVSDGRIVDVTAVSELPLDLPVHWQDDSTILPGLIDAHMHFMRWKSPLFLAYGVTTVRDTGNELEWILQCRESWRGHRSPRIVSLGPLLDGLRISHPVVARGVKDLADAVEAVRETLAAGVDGIKLYASIQPEWIPAMVRESHGGGRKVSMHCSKHGVLVAGRAGVDEFFHHDGILEDVWPDRPNGWLNVWGREGFADTWSRQQEVADEIAEIGMTATPTLAYWDSQWRMRCEVGPTPEELQYVPADLFKWAAAAGDPELGEEWRRGLEAAQRFTGTLFERGVPILAGSDTPCGGILPGQSLWREMELLVGSGMSTVEAIQSATSAVADFLQRPELGRLRPGAVADLVSVRGNPLQKITAWPEPGLVVLDGTAYEPRELLEAAEAPDEDWREDPWGRQYAQHWERWSKRANV